MKKINEGKRLTEKIQNQYGDIIKESATKIIQEEAKSYLDKMQNKVLSENDSSNSLETEIKVTNAETTPEEMELYYIIKAIAGQAVNPIEIISKDTKDYFAVMYQNQRQTFLRFYQSKNKTADCERSDLLCLKKFLRQYFRSLLLLLLQVRLCFI